MHHAFQVFALSPEICTPLFELSDEQLAARHARRVTALRKPGYPCRLSLADAEPGEELILFHYTHHEVDSPYRASGPVYIRKDAPAVALEPDVLPDHLRHRQLSLRGYDAEALLVEASTSAGAELDIALQKLLDNEQVRYVHIHNAAQGCYHCRVERFQR